LYGDEYIIEVVLVVVADGDRHGALVGELDRVGEQVEEDLSEPGD
jgi:soluble P-type ATPase